MAKCSCSAPSRLKQLLGSTWESVRAAGAGGGEQLYSGFTPSLLKTLTHGAKTQEKELKLEEKMGVLAQGESRSHSEGKYEPKVEVEGTARSA